MNEPSKPESDDSQRWAWAKLNAYGFVIAGLTVLGLTDLANPANTDLARLAGEVPAGQAWWIAGFAASGLLLLLGFLRTDRIAETVGLGMLTLSLGAQTVAAFGMLGWTDYSWTRLIILTMVAALTAARVSILWAREGLAVTIPPRRLPRGRR